MSEIREARQCRRFQLVRRADETLLVYLAELRRKALAAVRKWMTDTMSQP